MIDRIIKVYTRTYRDTGQVTTYVEWKDRRGRAGRTEGNIDDPHMTALLERAEREGKPHTKETWL